jgi:hypothetical protein
MYGPLQKCRSSDTCIPSLPQQENPVGPPNFRSSWYLDSIRYQFAFVTILTLSSAWMHCVSPMQSLTSLLSIQAIHTFAPEFVPKQVHPRERYVRSHTRVNASCTLQLFCIAVTALVVSSIGAVISAAVL